MKKNLIKVVVN